MVGAVAMAVVVDTSLIGLKTIAVVGSLTAWGSYEYGIRPVIMHVQAKSFPTFPHSYPYLKYYLFLSRGED